MAANWKFRWLAAWRTATKIRWLTSTAPDVWTEVLRIRRWSKISNQMVWKDVYVKTGTTPTPTPAPTPSPTPTPSVALNVTAVPSSVSGTRIGAGIVYTNTVTISASRGTGPYSFIFSRVSYSARTAPTIVASGVNKAQFSQNMTGTVPEHQTARFKCQVKDSKGNKGTVYINADFYTALEENTGGDNWVNNGGVGSGGATP